LRGNGKYKNLKEENISSFDILAHFKVAVFLALTVNTLESVIYVDIQIARVALVRGATNGSANLFTSLDSNSLGCIENSLLPVSVLGVGSGGESYGLVASGEGDVEPSNESMDVIVTSSSDLEVAGESQILLGHCKNIDFL
jgi:hypothetical protein